MTLATSTVYNKFRRELKTKLEALKNDSGEAIQMSSGEIAIGGALFKNVYTGRLYIDFIKHVADSGGELADLAKEVLKVDEMQFDRWYA